MSVPAEHAPSQDGYEESTAYQWTETAFDMLERGELRGEVISGKGIVRSRVWGPCPRCKHPMDDRQTHTAITNVFGGALRGPDLRAPESGTENAGLAYYQVDVSCCCGDMHTGTPVGRAGCGVSFRVELPVQTVRKSTPS